MNPIRDQSGAVLFLHPTGIDITERKQFEHALRESEQQLRWIASIVELSDDVIISKNFDGVIISWNKGAERVFGYTAEEAIGQPITIVIPEDRHDEERQILTRIRRGERIEHYETVRRRKHGSLIAVSLTVSPVRDAGDKIVGASKIARDITEQRRSQEQIATLAREAEHRSKNVLATVQATVHLSQSETPEGLKRAIEGRIQALANVHSLFVKSRWIGAELSAVARQELTPYTQNNELRVSIDGPEVLLEPNSAQAIAVTLHELSASSASSRKAAPPAGLPCLAPTVGNGHGTFPPTPAMKRFADSLARQKGIKPPPGYKTSISICRKFLNEHAPKKAEGETPGSSTPNR